MKVVANLSRRGHSQRNLWIISWCLAHTQLLAPALLRAAMATVVPEMITNSRGERDRDFALFTEGGGWSREEVVAESYNRQMPRGGGIAGGHLHSIHNRGGKAGRAGVLGSKGGWLKERGFPLSRQVYLLSHLTLCPSIMMTLRYHCLLFRFKLVGRMCEG